MGILYLIINTHLHAIIVTSEKGLVSYFVMIIILFIVQHRKKTFAKGKHGKKQSMIKFVN
jgi:hypothetical protein